MQNDKEQSQKQKQQLLAYYDKDKERKEQARPGTPRPPHPDLTQIQSAFAPMKPKT